MTLNVLVTGGAGYIGSFVAKQLSDEGYAPIVLDNLSTGFAKNVRWGPLFQGDVGDRNLIRDIHKHYPLAGVIHLAASAYVGESMEKPFKYFQNNVAQSISMLEALTDIGVSNLVFSSSCATYGVPNTRQISENHPQCPINPYGESKLLLEKILASLGSIGMMRHASLRYFNACGSSVELNLGEEHEPETHVIPLLVRAALKDEEFSIFGSDYETKDGTAVRDFIHVSDLAKAHILALERLLSGSNSFSVNLGTGIGVSIQDLITGLSQLGQSVKVKSESRRAGDPPSLVADSSKAQTFLGWKPEKSFIQSILADELTWQQFREAGR